MEQEQYQKLYNDFMNNYTLGAVKGGEKGCNMLRLAGFFPILTILQYMQKKKHSRQYLKKMPF